MGALVTRALASTDFAEGLTLSLLIPWSLLTVGAGSEQSSQYSVSPPRSPSGGSWPQLSPVHGASTGLSLVMPLGRVTSSVPLPRASGLQSPSGQVSGVTMPP